MRGYKILSIWYANSINNTGILFLIVENLNKIYSLNSLKLKRVGGMAQVLDWLYM